MERLAYCGSLPDGDDFDKERCADRGHGEHAPKRSRKRRSHPRRINYPSRQPQARPERDRQGARRRRPVQTTQEVRRNSTQGLRGEA